MKRYQMTASRYFPTLGLVKASPETPAVIELDDSIKPGPDMREIDKDGNVVGGPLVPAQFAVTVGGGKSDLANKPFDATEKRASGQFDGLEYREEGKRVKDQPAQVDAQTITVERVGEAPKSDDGSGQDKKQHHHRASDKKVI